MHQQAYQHRCTTGRRLWLCLALALGLVLGTQAAAARECHRETPLPAEVRLTPPGPEVPEAMARFAGAWTGVLEHERVSDALCHTLVVEEVFANGYGRVIFSVATSAAWGIPLPWHRRITGRIIDGALRFALPEPDHPSLAYRFAGQTLSGTVKGEGSVRLTRVADLRQVGCELPPAPPATGSRDRLTATELLTPAEVGTGPVHNAYFMPVGPAAPAVHPFTGTVTVQTATMLRGRQGCAGLADLLPGFTAAFFTHGEHLVPVVRDILDPPGTLILSPGRVWSEPGDGGLSRASFPFVVLPTHHSSETHHGLGTFVYDNTRVSALRFQVIQETDSWRNKYDGWGQAPMTYTPGPIPNEEALQAQFAAELHQQTPIRPWSALPAAAGVPALEGFDGDTAPENLKASGLIIDGAIYLRGCETRVGPSPYSLYTTKK